MVAEPLASVTDFLEDLSSDANWNQEVRGARVERGNQPQGPAIDLLWQSRSALNGDRSRVALTTGEQSIGAGGRSKAEVTFDESGRIVLISERPTQVRGFPGVSPSPPDQKVVLESLIVGNVDLAVRLAAEAGNKYGHYGAWHLAVVVTGLEGATSATLADPWGDPGPIYTYATYDRAVEATLAELEAEPEKVTARLVIKLLRSLGVHTHPNWQYLSA